MCVYCLSIVQSVISYVCILSQYCAVNDQLCVYIVSVLIVSIQIVDAVNRVLQFFLHMTYTYLCVVVGIL